jgi:predicted metal-dependent phosphoesterase TrpH
MHMHTIFSDANVWPDTRVEECYVEGVEVLCITDHMEARHKRMVNQGLFNCDRNKSYEIAAKRGKELGVTVIHGGEVTRRMPPGHFNVLFIDDVEPIAEVDDAHKSHLEGGLAALAEARKQGSFNVWNHPHWAAQSPTGAIWHDDHSKIFDAGLMDAIEVYNSCDGFSMEAFQWCIDKNLALICGTDSHKPMFMHLNANAGELRPVTLIFAKENSVEGVKEALNARRTAVFADGRVYGSPELLTMLVDACLEVVSVTQSGNTTRVTLKNNSSIPMILTKGEGGEQAAYTIFNIIDPFETHTYGCTGLEYKTPVAVDEFVLSFDFENFYTAPGQHFNYRINVKKPQ